MSYLLILIAGNVLYLGWSVHMYRRYNSSENETASQKAESTSQVVEIMGVAVILLIALYFLFQEM